MNKIAILILTAVLTSSVNNMFSQCISCAGSNTGSYANAMGLNNSALGGYSSAMGLSNQITPPLSVVCNYAFLMQCSLSLFYVRDRYVVNITA